MGVSYSGLDGTPPPGSQLSPPFPEKPAAFLGTVGLGMEVTQGPQPSPWCPPARLLLLSRALVPRGPSIHLLSWVQPACQAAQAFSLGPAAAGSRAWDGYGRVGIPVSSSQPPTRLLCLWGRAEGLHALGKRRQTGLPWHCPTAPALGGRPRAWFLGTESWAAHAGGSKVTRLHPLPTSRCMAPPTSLQPPRSPPASHQQTLRGWRRWSR